MDKRLELHETLCGIIGITEPNGDRHTYFQPPESLKMNYPAIRYSLDTMNVKKANDANYQVRPGYEIVLIDKNPDSVYVSKLLALPYCRFVRHYKADNLNHFIFTIY